MNTTGRLGYTRTFSALILLITLVAIPVSAATTQVHIVRYANDNTTVLDETTVNYTWMMNNLPVLGDGVTHYYHQGPVFVDDPNPETQAALRWNPEEDTNIEEKDNGAVKGTNLKDLCDLVGGMSPGEEVKVISSDGFTKWFGYKNVYEYSSREGPIGLTWYMNGLYPDTGYSDGMKLVWFADTSVNPWGIHAFGNYDWYLAADEKYWYYYQSGGQSYPTTTGLSSKYVNRIYIYSNEAPPAPLDVIFEGTVTLADGTFTWTDDSGVDHVVSTLTPHGALGAALLADGFTYGGSWHDTRNTALINWIHSGTTNYTYDGSVTPKLTWNYQKNGVFQNYFSATTGVSNNDVADGDFLEFYYGPDQQTTENATAVLRITVEVEGGAVPPDAAFTADPLSGVAPLTVQFTDESTGSPTEWAWDFTNDGTVDSTLQNPSFTYHTPGTYTVSLTMTSAAGSDDEVKTDYITVTSPPSIDELFNGTVTLNEGETFTVTAYNTGGGTYTVNRTTPLGALDAVATLQGFTYDVTDKNFASSGALLLDNIGTYLYQKTPRESWYAYVNDAYKDGYNNPAGALNLIGLNDGDTVEFYFVEGTIADPTDYAAVIAAASAAVKMAVDIQPAGPVVDTLFDGTVTLTPDTTFTVTAYNNASGTYTVNYTTPLGALETASKFGSGFTYDVTDKNFASSGALLLDNIGTYLYQKTPRKTWYGYVNDVFKDGYNNPAGALNLIALNDGDTVEFYFVDGTVADPTDYAAVTAAASAAVKITADIDGSTPTEPDWTLALSGARSQTVTKAYFEQGLACPSAGHMVNWTDGEGAEWSGIPLWVLVAMVDDNPDTGPDHYNFNDALAAEGYSIKVTADDGYSVNFESADIARNNEYIVASRLNGDPLPPLRPNSTKPCFPLQLIGPAIISGKMIGNISSIELVGLPVPPEGWTLRMEGDVVDGISQAYFEEAMDCIHPASWTDGTGNVWTGIPLWEILGSVDDIETAPHWTFNDDRSAAGYTIRVIAGDGYNRTFSSTDVARSGDYIVANTKNGAPLSGTEAPLRLVGANATGGKSVGNIVTIRLEGLPAYPAGNWSLLLDGAIRDTIPEPEFEDWAACHSATYDDGTGNVYEGIPLWRLMGWVDDRIPHGPNGFNNALATAGYKVIVTAGDGYSKEFTSQEIGTTNGFIIANRMNGQPLPTDGAHPPYPLRLVGAGLPSVHYSVGNVVKIELTDFQEPTEIPQIHIIKYDADGVTIINQTTVDHIWMEANLPVIGDGVTHYKYQGVTFDPGDLWDPTETKGMNPPKIDNAIKGTKARDLCDLVGGMEPGTEVTFVATDGWETTLPYDCIYTNPHVYSHLGETIIAWYADGQYVPQYGDGPRLFFTPEDHVAGQWNMHEALPEQYWHYYWSGGVQYPSVAGLSAKYVGTIKIYASPVTDWTLVLDGEAIDGLNQTISRNYFESALACQFGADHKASYTDSQGRTWEGMPLWFLAGFVDDEDQHSDNAYNDTKALDGYRIIVTGSDGYNATFNSQDTIRNANFIVANTLNGTRIAEGDSSWPLRLVGQNVTGGKVVRSVASIVLAPLAEPPVADFEASPLSGNAPLLVQFTDLSTGDPLEWAWDFQDDGTIDSTAQNPSYVYQDPGTYSIRLTVKNDGGTSTKTKSQYVTVTFGPPSADFSASPVTGASPLLVQFTDLTTGNPLEWAWDFQDDGTIDSTAQNPSYVYQDQGTYSIRLTVTNAGGTSTKTKSQYVTVTVGPPSASFTASPRSGNWPLMVSFTDTSTGSQIQSWEWDFGDGKKSPKRNPIHTYLKPGIYTATLTIRHPQGSDTASETIEVMGDFTASAVIKTPLALFSQSSVIGTPPLSVSFTDLSLKNPSSWLWDFGDGGASNEQNPSHTFDKAGMYTVRLNVTNDYGFSSAVKRVFVTPLLSFFSR